VRRRPLLRLVELLRRLARALVQRLRALVLRREPEPVSLLVLAVLGQLVRGLRRELRRLRRHWKPN
jgi:hypothetical protein